MKNNERYKRTFSVLHASDKIVEVKSMKNADRIYVRKFVPVLVAAVLLLGITTAAYAADIGGIQKTVQLWIHGNQKNAVMEVTDGQYTLTYEDEAGNAKQQSGGGVAIEDDGTERPLTEEELMDELNSPEVEYKDDGKVIVYYHEQTIDITDKFENGICYVEIPDGEKKLNMTVKYKDGYSISYDYGDSK